MTDQPTVKFKHCEVTVSELVDFAKIIRRSMPVGSTTEEICREVISAIELGAGETPKDLLTPSEAKSAKLRAAASDLSRVADDYEHEGLQAVADRMRRHAVNLWRIACEP